MSAWGVITSLLGSGSPQTSSARPAASPAQPVQPSGSDASRPRWLAWLPACLSPVAREPSPRTSPIVIEDPKEDEAMMGEENADEEEDGRKRKGARGEYGTEDERWAARSSRHGVMGDLATGCPCGCTDLLNVGEVLEARAEMGRHDAAGRRTFTRTYLDSNVAPAKRGGYNFHPVTDSSRSLCYRGWEVRRVRTHSERFWSMSHVMFCAHAARRCCMDSRRDGFIVM